MKLLKKADRIQVKRALLVTPYLRKFGIAGRYATKPPTKVQFKNALRKAKEILDKKSEKQLDALIDYKKRLKAYNAADWYVADVAMNEIGVWRGAGGLPRAWTKDSVLQTAHEVKKGLTTNSKNIRMRAKRAIPAIIALKSIIVKEPLQYPILFEAGMGTNGRRGLPKMKGDIDDGNMRAIALAVSGQKRIRAYFGLFPK